MTDQEKRELKASMRAYDEARARHPRNAEKRNRLYDELFAKYNKSDD